LLTQVLVRVSHTNFDVTTANVYIWKDFVLDIIFVETAASKSLAKFAVSRT
jgi:hypothetical protein